MEISVLETKISLAKENARILNEQIEGTETEVKTLKQPLTELNEKKEAAALQYKQCLEIMAKSIHIGSHNDINVLERSFIFTKLAQGHAPLVNYTINGNDYTMGYYLADGIYPKWSTFVKTIPSPQGNKKTNFATAQESARKDVERAFGVLQQRFAIVGGPYRIFKVNDLTNIMKACVILHNKIIEDERDDSQGLDME
ncbi:hypothetical protein F2P56_004076 [Juglans regia]|uniref:Uncharacterized protein LOC108995440 n=2 Tax=Juglans regia TaxID=51240 RepID=A0A2I4F4K1_JUGRE|nr:uncharacterized protein LOC108995440 [Juglans regia]KAF5477436.1 hypothetical protein F2P56_004076 [Juglans regia]